MALGRKRGARSHLLGFGFGRHIASPVSGCANETLQLGECFVVRYLPRRRLAEYGRGLRFARDSAGAGRPLRPIARAFLLASASFCRHFNIKTAIHGDFGASGGGLLSVLITGAGGFIGSHVTRQLLADGEEVHVFLREGGSAERLAGSDGFHRWTGGLDDVVALASCMKRARPERIFHCAGVSRARHMSGWAPVREAL